MGDADDLRAALTESRISWCVFTEESAGVTRFPESGWLDGSVGDLADLVRLVSVPQRAVDEAATTLQEGIDAAAKVLDELNTTRSGPVEVDETYIGGKSRNMHASKQLKAGRGPVGKATIAGAKDRDTNRISAAVVPSTGRATLQAFVAERAAQGATVYTDDHPSYKGIPFAHKSVRHSVSEYVKDQAHTNGIESFWATLKRGYHGTYHHVSAKHLSRYVAEFEGRHNSRPADTVDQIASIVQGMNGKRLRYQDLVA